MLENSPDVSVVYTAILRAGAAIIPVIFLLTAEELRWVITNSEASAIITAPAFLDDGRWRARARIRCASSCAPASLRRERTHSMRWPSTRAVRSSIGTTTTSLFFSTRAARPGAPRCGAQPLQRLAGPAGRDELRQPDIVRGIACLPLSHSYGVLGLASGLHATTPFKSVLMKWFEPKLWLQLAQDHQVQAGAVAPSMIYMLLQQPLEDYDLSNLRLIGSGAAPLTAEAREELKRRLPQIRVARRGLRSD